MQALEDGTIKAGDVVVIRYEGPKGGPGMREMLMITGASKAQVLEICSFINRWSILWWHNRALCWPCCARGG